MLDAAVSFLNAAVAFSTPAMLDVAVYSLAVFTERISAAQFQSARRPAFSTSPLPLNASPPHLRPSPSAPPHPHVPPPFSTSPRPPTSAPLDARTPVAAVSDSAPPRSAAAPLARPPAVFDVAAPRRACHRPFDAAPPPCPCHSSRARHLTRPRRRLTRCHRTFRRRRSSPRSRLCRRLSPQTHHGRGWKRRQGRDPTPGARRLSPSSLPELPLRPSTPPVFSTPAALDAAVPFLDVTVFDVAGCLFGTRYCSYRTGHFHAAVCARSTHARHHRFRHSATAPRYLRVPPGLSTPESMAPRPDCRRVRRSWSPVCETEGGHDLQVMSSLHPHTGWYASLPAFFTLLFSFTRLDVSQRVVALGGQQVAGIQLLGALTFSSRRNGDVLKNIEWALVPQNERRPFSKTPHLFCLGCWFVWAAGSVMY
ncbi:hypothetical protein MSAN_02534700 [Mycena sanguinolenta]|uniref:Uncharacterized protein n=1 Tax=Mycena sanguinolenta TaxID=230812 RepID=A0A8H6TVH7_9AGAR|nr:hypothetical protein MSAN_02534700 [Mycena sanguinolenta]